MELIHFVLRDEIVNINAMTKGGLQNKYSHQILICKKQPNINTTIPFLLDPKTHPPQKYPLSKIGEWYQDKVSADHFPLKYVGFIDLQIKFQVDVNVFSDLAEKHFFSVWDPSAPMTYFKGKKSGYLVVFRVYEIKKPIKEHLLSKRNCLHYYFSLDEDQIAELGDPVINNENFDKMKQELIGLLKTNGSFLEIHKP